METDKECKTGGNGDHIETPVDDLVSTETVDPTLLGMAYRLPWERSLDETVLDMETDAPIRGRAIQMFRARALMFSLDSKDQEKTKEDRN